MTTIPSADRPHEWGKARDQGQGEQPFCIHCGVRKSAAEVLPQCIPALPAPRKVASEYDPFNL